MFIFQNTDLNVTYSASTINLLFKTDNVTTNIRVESSVSWITTGYMYNSNTLSGTLTINISSNNNNPRRYATVTITGYDNTTSSTISSTITISQDSGEFSGDASIYKLLIDQNEVSQPLNIDDNAHKLTVIIKTDLTITRVIPDTAVLPNWITKYSQQTTPSPDSDSLYEYIVYDVSDNLTSSDRTASLSFKIYDYKNATKTLTLNATQLSNRSPIIYAEDAYISAAQQQFTIYVTTTNVTIDDIVMNEDWLEIYSYTDNILTLNASSNVTTSPRRGHITIIGTSTNDSSIHTSFTINVHQERAAATGYIPVWRDTLIPLGLSDVHYNDKYFNIFINNNIIYRGHTYNIDDEETYINISSFVREYVDDKLRLPASSTIIITPFTPVKVFTEDNNIVADLYYYYDYTFDDTIGTSYIRNSSVLNTVAANQLIIFSVFNPAGEEHAIKITTSDGSTDSTRTFILHEAGIHHITLPVEDNAIKVTFSHDSVKDIIEYDVIRKCNNNILYYLNKLGGWDSMIFSGRNIATDSYDINAAKNKALNIANDDEQYNFEQYHYLKNINRTYKLTTSWLTDNEAELMSNVFTTTRAYLYTNGKFVPVLVNNKNYEKKTFNNQGRKLYNYTIELTESQNKFIY